MRAKQHDWRDVQDLWADLDLGSTKRRRDAWREQRQRGPSQTLMSKPKETVGPYVLTSVLGEGNFGKVRLGIHQDTLQKVSVLC